MPTTTIAKASLLTPPPSLLFRSSGDGVVTLTVPQSVAAIRFLRDDVGNDNRLEISPPSSSLPHPLPSKPPPLREWKQETEGGGGEQFDGYVPTECVSVVNASLPKTHCSSSSPCPPARKTVFILLLLSLPFFAVEH